MTQKQKKAFEAVFGMFGVWHVWCVLNSHASKHWKTRLQEIIVQDTMRNPHCSPYALLQILQPVFTQFEVAK